MLRINSLLKNLQNTQGVVTSFSRLQCLIGYPGLFFNYSTTPINYFKQSILGLTLENKQPQRSFTSEAGKVQPPIGVSDFRKLIEHKDLEGNPYL